MADETNEKIETQVCNTWDDIITEEFCELSFCDAVQGFLFERFGINFHGADSEQAHLCFDLMEVIDTHMIKPQKQKKARCSNG